MNFWIHFIKSIYNILLILSYILLILVYILISDNFSMNLGWSIFLFWMISNTFETIECLEVVIIFIISSSIIYCLMYNYEWSDYLNYYWYHSSLYFVSYQLFISCSTLIGLILSRVVPISDWFIVLFSIFSLLSLSIIIL